MTKPSIRFDAKVIPYIKAQVAALHLDSATALFTERALTKVIKEANVLHTMNQARLYIPTAKLSDPGHTTTEVIAYEAIGQAECIDPNSDDVPMLQLIANSKPLSRKFIAFGYTYSQDDIEKASVANMDLSTRARDEAIKRVNDKLDSLMLFGEDDMTGLFNDPNITLASLPNAGAWEGLTNQQIAENILHQRAQVRVISKKHFQVNSAIFPLTLLSLLETRYNENTGRSLYDEVMASLGLRGVPAGNVFAEEELETAGSGGARRVLMYFRNPMVLQANIPMEPTTIPVQTENFKFKFLIKSYYGGLNVYYPIACVYADVPV